jgi:hypothetical protein
MSKVKALPTARPGGRNRHHVDGGRAVLVDDVALHVDAPRTRSPYRATLAALPSRQESSTAIIRRCPPSDAGCGRL